MKMRKIILGAIMVMLLSVLFCFGASAEINYGNVVDSGNCGANGDNVTYVLYEDGTLVISGEGAMAEYAFANNTNIKNLNIEAGVAGIGEGAFWYCSELTSVTIGENVTSIDGYAFYCCTSLESVAIEDSVTSIGDHVFSNCTSLESVAIGDSVTSIGDYVFSDCASLTSVTIGDNVTSIGDYAFYYCTSLESVIIGDNVTSIGDYAFYYCKNLTSVTIGDNVASIGHNAFCFCTSLTSVIIGDNVTSIGGNAFYDCTSLTDVTIGEGVTTIGNYAFCGCDSLTDITLPNSVTNVGDMAFSNCDSLETITILNMECEINGLLVTFGSSTIIYGHIGSTTQKYAEKYSATFKVFCPTNHTNTSESPEVNATCKTDGHTAGLKCDDCSSWLTGEVIKASHTDENTDNICDVCGGDTRIVETGDCGADGDNVIYTLYTDGTLVISGTGNMVDYYDNFGSPLYNRDEIKTVIVKEGITGIGRNAVRGCKNLTKLTLPEGLKTIGFYSFGDCSSLTGVIIPESVTRIDMYAFMYTDIRDIVIPKNVSSIGAFALYGCSNLTSITFLNPECYIDHEGSAWISTNAVIYGYADSTAKEYVEWFDYYDYTFVPIDCHHKNTVTFKAYEPTCISVGYAYGVFCNDCEEWINGCHEEIPSPGHIMGQWNVTREATLLDEGSRTRKCTVCTHSETETIAKLVGDTTTDEKSGIEIEYIDASYDGKEMEVKVEEDYTGTQYIAQSLGVEYSGTVSFNIKTYVDGVEVQPSEPVLVRIPLPADFNPDAVAVYHIKTGVPERIIPVYIKDGYIEFLATSFSIYTVVDESSEIIAEPDAPEEPANTCLHMCHKTGVMNVLWKIVRFFWKLFGMNPICSCGASHY